jgi:hypothetical protein
MLAALPIIQLAIAAVGELPALVTALNTVKTLITEQRDPTADEQAQFDAALAEAEKNIPAA